MILFCCCFSNNGMTRFLPVLLLNPHCITPSHTQVATSKILPGEGICPYLGIIREEDVFNKKFCDYNRAADANMYAYDVQKSQISPHYGGPSLLIEVRF